MEWDTAAGHAVLTAAGGQMLKPDGAPLHLRQRRCRLQERPVHRLGPRAGLAFRLRLVQDTPSMNLTSLAMTDTLPDRLSQNPKSPHYNKELLERGIGIRFNGQEKTNVWEYCVSEGWVRVVAGVAMDRKGNPMTLLLKGAVEPYIDGRPAE